MTQLESQQSLHTEGHQLLILEQWLSNFITDNYGWAYYKCLKLNFCLGRCGMVPSPFSLMHMFLPIGHIWRKCIPCLSSLPCSIWRYWKLNPENSHLNWTHLKIICLGTCLLTSKVTGVEVTTKNLTFLKRRKKCMIMGTAKFLLNYKKFVWKLWTIGPACQTSNRKSCLWGKNAQATWHQKPHDSGDKISEFKW